jgi:hypothetical protein
VLTSPVAEHTTRTGPCPLPQAERQLAEARPDRDLAGRALPNGAWGFAAIPVCPPARPGSGAWRPARPVQAKLRVGAVDDPLEREADAVADRVLGTAGTELSAGPPVTVTTAAPLVSRACCAECEENERVQRKPAGPCAAGCGEAPGVVSEVVGSGGRSLDDATRSFFEPRFGHDLAGVRVHTGALADESARGMNARAYTLGSDIVFASGGFAPGTREGRQLLAHELTHVLQQRGERVAQLQHAPRLVQRTCGKADLGDAKPECLPSQAGVSGWPLRFKVGCDELLPGEAAQVSKLKVGSQLNIHGYASKEGDPLFNDQLSCHRANVVADLVRSQRADCPVLGIFKHGASPATGPGLVQDPNPPEFWRTVIIQEIKRPLESGEQWLDPGSTINDGWALLSRAKANPTQANLDLIAARRPGLQAWLVGIGRSVAPSNAQLNRRNIDDYRRFYSSAEKLWMAIDQQLALQKHPDATKDTYDGWAKGTGVDQDPTEQFHARGVPKGARYQIDLFGEGRFPGAINIGNTERTTTTGIPKTRIPNLIYRNYSFSDVSKNKIPIADHVADLVTSENGPLVFAGIAQEIARIVAPGGTIILYNPDNEEASHDKVAKLTGGTVTKVKANGSIQTTIVVPAATP